MNDHVSQARLHSANGVLSQHPDPQETAEWLDALESTVTANGAGDASDPERLWRARQKGIGWAPELSTPYVNTIAVTDQPAFPGDLAIEERLGALMRWNALAMVVRANQAYGELGGHIASYASAADLFEVGFNHFFRARDSRHDGDLVFFQPHSSPGVYARAFLAGRLSEDDLLHYRQELTCRGAGRPRSVQLPASLSDARLLAVPHRLDGHRTHQLDLPRALHALPDGSQAPRLSRQKGLGCLR
jgi:pyruvate dehydrogenase E1 component